MNFENELDDFSWKFSKELFSIYPDWTILAKRGRAKDAARDHLIVEVPAPIGSDLASTLLIHTDNEEVTIGFDYEHAHFFPQHAIPLYSDALEYLAAILSETVAAVSEWRGNTWHASWTVDREEVEDLATSDLRPGYRLRIRSWNGSRDLDLMSLRDGS